MAYSKIGRQCDSSRNSLTRSEVWLHFERMELTEVKNFLLMLDRSTWKDLALFRQIPRYSRSCTHGSSVDPRSRVEGWISSSGPIFMHFDLEGLYLMPSSDPTESHILQAFSAGL